MGARWKSRVHPCRIPLKGPTMTDKRETMKTVRDELMELARKQTGTLVTYEYINAIIETFTGRITEEWFTQMAVEIGQKHRPKALYTTGGVSKSTRRIYKDFVNAINQELGG